MGLGAGTTSGSSGERQKIKKGPAPDTGGVGDLFARRWSLLSVPKSKQEWKKRIFVGIRPVGQRSMGRKMECDGAASWSQVEIRGTAGNCAGN